MKQYPGSLDGSCAEFTYTFQDLPAHFTDAYKGSPTIKADSTISSGVIAGTTGTSQLLGAGHASMSCQRQCLNLNIMRGGSFSTGQRKDRSALVC